MRLTAFLNMLISTCLAGIVLHDEPLPLGQGSAQLPLTIFLFYAIISRYVSGGGWGHPAVDGTCQVSMPHGIRFDSGTLRPS